MAWTVWDDTPAPMLCWTTRLTAAEPEAGPLPLALLKTATAQVSGVFGAGVVELECSNGPGWVPLRTVRHNELEPVPAAALFTARVVDPDDTTNVQITVAGHR